MVKFFINRPIFATVIAIMMIIVGLACIFALPIQQFPEIVPPEVTVTTTYPGANSEVVANTVTTPLEESINGVEGMVHISSQSSNTGISVITVAFEIGSDLNVNEVNVLNRTDPAKPLLPATALKTGIVINKVSNNLLMAINLLSPNHTYNSKFLTNYANIHIVNVLQRIPGVGAVNNFGYLYAIRVWLDPNKMASLNIAVSDVVLALEDQNRQAASGAIGAEPAPADQAFTIQVNTLGRLKQVEQFGDIVIKAGKDGALVKLKDIAKIELGAEDYSNNSHLNNISTNSILVYPLPGANAIQISGQVQAVLKDLARYFPDNMTYKITYNSVIFVKESLREVVITLFFAMLLVILVIYVFLQRWRTALIPCIAIPVSLIGSFIFLYLAGFSINTLSLLGLVLAIGLVVDDAIVVVENIERRIEKGAKNIKQITLDAMKEVQGPIIATTSILLAVFIPIAFMPGLSGRLYNQFALTIAFAVALSGINSLTLSPALSSILLKTEHPEPKRFFRWFNRGFDRLIKFYRGLVIKFIHYWRFVLIGFVLLSLVTVFAYHILPRSFLPQEDQGHFIISTQGPDASSLQRTDQTLQRVSEIVEKYPGVENVLTISGFSILTGVNQSNAGLAFVILKPWQERRSEDQSTTSLIARAQKELGKVEDAKIAVSNAASIPGLSPVGGFNMEIQDTNSLGLDVLADATNNLIKAANVSSEIAYAFTTFTANSPQVYLDIDRNKAKALQVPIGEVLDTLQAYLGSFYVNQMNKFGKTYWVIIQAAPEARNMVDDVSKFYVRSTMHEMVPLSALVKIKLIKGPINISHYNLYPSASINGEAAPGYSSLDAVRKMEALADKVLPKGIHYTWTGVTYQQLKAGNMAPIIFMVCLVFVFLFLAALYESWSMPFMILLVVPTALLGAILALHLRSMSLDIYGQVGLVLLIALAAKNAILIVEFAKDKHEEGLGIVEAALQAAILRVRPILMTAFAFILGVLPLAIATGAGAMSRHSIGTVVLGGMLAATILSLLVVPVFYVVIQSARERIAEKLKSE